MTDARPAGLVVVMGVAGSGKSTLAAPLAGRLGWTFLEADEFHPEANVERIRAGVPLTDEDRLPWLLALRDEVRRHLESGRGVVLACSALKASYREILSDHPARTEFVLLDPDAGTLRRRLAARTGHFAGVSILPSQLATLERPGCALVLRGSPPFEQALSLVVAHLSGSGRRDDSSGTAPDPGIRHTLPEPP